MNRTHVQKKLKSITNLPTLPIIAMQVNQLLADTGSSIDELVDLIQKDQSLVTKILRLVNSSFYGFKGKVKTIRHAVTLMGCNTIRNAVVTTSVIEALNIKTKLDNFKIDELWRHSICVAVMSRYIAGKSKLADTEDAFTAGLLHDIGKVILAAYFADKLTQILEQSCHYGSTFHAAEENLNYCPHNVIGSLMAQHWVLPDPLIKAIHYHHSSVDRSDQNGLIGVVNAANRIVHMMAGHKGYSLISEAGSALHENMRTIMESLKKKEIWLYQIKLQMDEACKFFDKG